MSRYYSPGLLVRLTLTAWVAFVLLGGGIPARAQAPQDPGPAQAPPQQMLTADQLDDLVAPIALYPDPLLSQVLVATTYPLEVVEAQQWLHRNSNLKGTQLMDAARQQNWDASVQALVALPDVLARLNQDVHWTTDLGNAFLAQQADVMSAVQRMRARAQANGKLNSTPQQTVTSENQGGQSAIQIQPADPQEIYVPYYDPMYVWGPPVWGYYPGLYYPPYGFGFGPGINIGFSFGGWGGWGFGGWGWGWGPNWFGGSVFVNHAFFNHYGYGFGRGFGGVGVGGRALWAHDPGHRLGVPYSNRQLAGRFGAASAASRAQRFGGQSSFNRSLGANGANRGSSFGGRSSVQGSQSYRGSPYQSGRANSSTGNFQSRQSSPSTGRSFGGGTNPRSFNSSPSNPRSFSGNNSPRSFSGGNSPRSFSGSSSPRSFSGSSSPRSFSGGSSPRSFSGGGGSSSPRSFSGGGGGHSFGGGGGHSFGGGGGHSGGGGHGGRH